MSFTEAVQSKSATVADLTSRPLQLTDGALPEKDKKEILKAVHDLADGKTLTQLYRDLGKIRQPTPPGGFRPDAKAVQAWLKEHHPDLLGTKFDDLPAPIRKAFQKQYKPKIDPELEAQTARDAIAHGLELLMRAHDDGDFAHYHMDDPDHVALFENWLPFLTGDLVPALRAQLQGAPKSKKKPQKHAKAAK